jgi:ABC-type multidrug transport system fused ATPase/permease subunit
LPLFYLIFISYFKSSLFANSKTLASAIVERQHNLDKAISGFRDIRLNFLESVLVSDFSRSDHNVWFSEARNLLISSLPRFLIEPAGYSLVVLIIILGYLSPNASFFSFAQAGTVLFALQKALPSFQLAYNSWSRSKSCLPQVITLCSELSSFRLVTDNDYLNKFSRHFSFQPIKPLLSVENISFSYHANKCLFKDLSFSLLPGESLLIKGSSGSGKSTLIDIITGNLIPDSGHISLGSLDHSWTIDSGLSSNNQLTPSSWSSRISYASQFPCIFDDTILFNITLRHDLHSIDFERFWQVTKIACLHSFIIKNKDRETTLIGQAYLQVSGGQIQRIGIARALYKKSNLLLLDEPTSALNPSLSLSIMSNILNLQHSNGIIVISHDESISYLFDRHVNLG